MEYYGGLILPKTKIFTESLPYFSTHPFTANKPTVDFPQKTVLNDTKPNDSRQTVTPSTECESFDLMGILCCVHQLLY